MGGFLVISKQLVAYIYYHKKGPTKWEDLLWLVSCLQLTFVIIRRDHVMGGFLHPSLNSPSRARTYNPSVNSRVLYH